MEHLKQWHDCYQGTLTANETALYINIFMIANRRRWPEWVEITDAQLAFVANIRERTIPDIINSLVQRGLIVSKRKKGKAPSAYQIIDLSPSYYVKNDVINPRYIRDKSEISPRYIRDKSEISPRLEENSPCESKDGEAPKTKTKTKTTQDTTKDNNAHFATFWAAYPKHKGKEAAQKAFAKINPSEELLGIMLSAIEKAKHTESWEKDNGQFIPYPATWLNGKRWEDEEIVKTSSFSVDYPIQQGDDDFGLPETV